MAVPDDRLGAGPTVFDQAHLRFLQHTIADVKIKVRFWPAFALPAYCLGSCSTLQAREVCLVAPCSNIWCLRCKVLCTSLVEQATHGVSVANGVLRCTESASTQCIASPAFSSCYL